MEDHERTRIEALADRDEELRSLWVEHQELEQRLEEMAARSYLSAEEELERKRLQKVKLAGKDRIVLILSQHSA